MGLDTCLNYGAVVDNDTPLSFVASGILALTDCKHACFYLSDLFLTGTVGLPTPKVDLFSPDGQPQISEARILSHVAELTDPNIIGYRTVGTRAHALGDAWAVEQVKALVSLCDTIKAQASAEGRTVDLECEWDRQQGSGTHK
jgi:hypothetical protein